MELLESYIKVLIAPASFFIIGKYIIAKQATHEKDIDAIKQVLNGWGEQTGLIEKVNHTTNKLELLEKKVDKNGL